MAELEPHLGLDGNQVRTFDAAKMQVLNLPEVIRSAGPRWPALRDRIRSGSMKFLTERLDPDDLVIPAGDGFLIVFARGETEALSERTEELRLALTKFYIGEEGMRELELKASMQRIEGAEVTKIMSPPPPRVVATALSEEHAFAPVWLPSQSIVAAYVCTPLLRKDGVTSFGYDPAYAETGRAPRRDYCRFDRNLIAAAEQAMRACSEEGGLCPAVFLPVHCTTLMYRVTRQAYLERLAAVPDELRQRIVIVIAEIERGLPLLRLADWIGQFCPHVKRVMLQYHISDPIPPDLSKVDAWGVGLSAPVEATPESARMLSQWRHAVGRCDRRFFVENIADEKGLTLAVQLGAHFVTSAKFWPQQPRVDGVKSAAAPFTQPVKPLSSAAM